MDVRPFGFFPRSPAIRRLLFAGIGLLAVSTLLLSRWRSTPAEPCVDVSTRVIDLGDGKPGQSLSQKFEIYNRGSGVLDFTIARSCSCTYLHPKEGHIPAGGSVSVEVTLTLPNYANTEKTAQVTVNSNDRLNPSVICTAIAKSPAAFTVSPLFVNFGSVAPTDIEGKAINLTLGWPPKRAIASSSQKKFGFRADGDNFAITQVSEMQLSITPLPHLSTGEHSGAIEVFLEGGEDAPIRIPLRIQVAPPLFAVPSTVYLKKENESGYQPANIILVTDQSVPSINTVQLIEGPPGATINELHQIDAHRIQCQLTVPASLEVADHRFALTVAVTDSNGATLQCPLTLALPK